MLPKATIVTLKMHTNNYGYNMITLYTLILSLFVYLLTLTIVAFGYIWNCTWMQNEECHTARGIQTCSQGILTEGEGLSTFDLHIKATCFAKKVNNFFSTLKAADLI